MKRVTCLKNKELKNIEGLEKSEYDTLSNNLKPLNTLFLELNFINDLKSCFQELYCIVDDFISGKINYKTLEDSINKLVLNYLSQSRAILDKWEKYLKNNFGNNSKEAENLKNLTARELLKMSMIKKLLN